MKKAFIYVFVLVFIQSCRIYPGFYNTDRVISTPAYSPINFYNPYSYDSFLYRWSWYNRNLYYYNYRPYYQTNPTITPNPRIPSNPSRIGPRPRR